MNGLVSIIVACYNGAQYIERCFDCILNQTYKKLEVIFGDDGSSDGSFQIAQTFKIRFEQQGMTLKCFSQSNMGMVTNMALSLATGEYIAVYDVDDILYPESIEKRVNFMKTHVEYACVRTNGYKRGEKGNKELFITNPKEKSNEHIFEDLLFGRTNNWSGSYMVRRNALDAVYKDQWLFETRYGANLQILMAVAYNNKSGYIDEPLMEYMYNIGSITRTDQCYETDRVRYLGFKAIREAILRQLGIFSEYQKELDSAYLNIFLDLDLTYNMIDQYMQDYKALLDNGSEPQLIHTYYYHKFNDSKILAFYIRLKLLISKYLEV